MIFSPICSTRLKSVHTAVSFDHVGAALDLLQGAVQLLAGFHLQGGGDIAGFVFVDLHRQGRQGDAHILDIIGDFSQQGIVIVADDLDIGAEGARVLHGPGNGNGSFGLGVQGVHAVRLVHGDPPAPGDVAHNIVARHGIAALGEAHQHARLPVHINAVGGLALGLHRGHVVHDGHLGGLGRVPFLLFIDQPTEHVHRRHAAVADSAVNIVQFLEHVFFQQRLVILGLGVISKLHAPALGLVLQHFMALLHVFAPQLPLEELADFSLGLLGFHDFQPVHAGALGGGGGEHLYPVAGFQLGIQGHHFAVDFRAHAGVAHLGMDAVGKIQGRSSPLHGNDVALGGEQKHFLGEQIRFQAVDEFVAVPGFTLPVQNLAQPVQLIVQAPVLLAALLVAPMSCDAVFRHPVHFPGADLDFKGEGNLPPAHHRGMQRLVHVGLGHGNIILEPARYLVPKRMGDAQHGVALRNGVHDHADGD